MKGSLIWRITLTFFVTIMGVYFLLPTVIDESSSWSDSPFLPDTKINQGLDLMGGIHLTLGVDIDKAVENAMSQYGTDIRMVARDESIAILKPKANIHGELVFLLAKGEQEDTLRGLLEESFSGLQVKEAETLEDGKVRFILVLTPEAQKNLHDLTLKQAEKTIRNRIDAFGVAEPDIRRMQDYRIQIQLPGLTDTERAIENIERIAHLEFKIVYESTEAEMEKALNGVLPPGVELGYIQRMLLDGTYAEDPILLEEEAVMTGENITDAAIAFDTQQFNKPYVTLTFNTKGSRDFERVTGEFVNHRMAIILDGKVYSAPNIKEKIHGGRASISGNFTVEEATDLAAVLRAGALPVPVQILESRSVGPSLGQESIDKGRYAAMLGMCAVLIFMAIYYGFAGFVADVVLVLNIVLIMAGLAMFGATLTLPGIAGIILTIGMAVDANVLIFERIREELRNGLTPLAAVDTGYSRATLTILDANVTTIIAAIILYQFGTGPVRGFAVTLTLGILASMFTAIFVSRIFFDLWLGRKQGARLSI